MWEDPIVAEVHRIREKLAAAHNYDVKTMFADMRARQAALGDRLVTRTKPSESGDIIVTSGGTLDPATTELAPIT